MGGCLGSSRHRSSPVSIGKNHPLKAEKPKWKSDIPLTDGQLKSKRDEFWDTAPVFEGRKEIWDALKAAAQALEGGDHQLAQAIVDGASITLPNGTLLDCYDELGTRYQLPVYVLSLPTNLVDEASSHTDAAATLDELSPAHAQQQQQQTGKEVTLKLRLSHSNKDMKVTCRSTDSVLKVKRMIGERDGGVEAHRQRWCFGGRLISNKIKIEDANIPKDCIVQVLVTMPITADATDAT